MFLFIGLDSDCSFLAKISDKIDKLMFGCWFEIEINFFNNIKACEFKYCDLENINSIISFYNTTPFMGLFLNMDSFFININNSSEKNVLFLKLIWIFFEYIFKSFINEDFCFDIDISVFYECLEKYFQDFFLKGNVILNSAMDMSVIILGLVIFKCNQQTVVFNLPAGAGKTFHLEYLSRLFKKKLLIACPTAKACHEFNKLGSQAQIYTIHSTFNINPTNNKIDSKKLFNSNILIDKEIFIFDEFSMIPTQIYSELKAYLWSKWLFFVGDAAQFRPVKAKGFLNDSLITFECTEDFFMPRFENATHYNYPLFLLSLRNKILFNKAISPNDNNCSYILNIIRENSTEFKMNDHLSSIKSHIQIARDEINKGTFNIPNIYPIITSTNKTGFLIQEELNCFEANDILMESCLYLNENQLTLGEKIEKKNFYLANIQANIGNKNNKLLKGCFVAFKRNFLRNDIINGKCAILCDIIYSENFKVLETIDFEFGTNLTKKISIYKGKLPIIKLWDIEENRMLTLEAQTEQCPCMDYGINCNLHYKLEVFFIEPAYSMTLHQLQGSTVQSNRKLYTADDIFKSDCLRSAYVLFSRAVNPNSLILNKKCLELFEKKLFE